MIQFVSEDVFNQIDGVRQIIAGEYSRKFAVIELEGKLGNYGLSWNSDLIEPIVKRSPDQSALWIGVDRQLAAICLRTGRVLLKLNLFTNLVNIEFADSKAAVIAETEVFTFNESATTMVSYWLPEIAIDAVFFEAKLSVKLLDGQEFILDLQTGKSTISNPLVRSPGS
ncbi:hypothetical protein H6F67_18410 [Microcoleus sp. FACHB-1515]|uniref:hypothetical protein n=1 Tax=Cyanophyceae TaxID=3028117 RepID=UPI00168A206A|nr:hypothetical protein [Microcoleus sp. FACHB-1515]MBD2091820.1 hypothetical protein [Microcoleus sp. FACHB-1515]